MAQSSFAVTKHLSPPSGSRTMPTPWEILEGLLPQAIECAKEKRLVVRLATKVQHTAIIKDRACQWCGILPQRDYIKREMDLQDLDLSEKTQTWVLVPEDDWGTVDIRCSLDVIPLEAMYAAPNSGEVQERFVLAVTRLLVPPQWRGYNWGKLLVLLGLNELIFSPVAAYARNKPLFIYGFSDLRSGYYDPPCEIGPKFVTTWGVEDDDMDRILTEDCSSLECWDEARYIKREDLADILERDVRLSVTELAKIHFERHRWFIKPTFEHLEHQYVKCDLNLKYLWSRRRLGRVGAIISTPNAPFSFALWVINARLNKLTILHLRYAERSQLVALISKAQDSARWWGVKKIEAWNIPPGDLRGIEKAVQAEDGLPTIFYCGPRGAREFVDIQPYIAGL